MPSSTAGRWEKFDDKPLPEVDTETLSTLDTWIETVAKSGSWDFAYPLIQSTIIKDGRKCAAEVGLTKWQTIFTSSPTSELLKFHFNKAELKRIGSLQHRRNRPETIPRAPNSWINKNFSAIRRTVTDELSDTGILNRIHGRIAAAANLMRLFGDVKRENFYIHLDYRLLEWPSLIESERESTRVSLVQKLRPYGPGNMRGLFRAQDDAWKEDIIFTWEDLLFQEGKDEAEMTQERRSMLLEKRGRELLEKLRPSFDETESLTARQWNKLMGGVRT